MPFRKKRQEPEGGGGPAPPDALAVVWDLLDDDRHDEAITTADRLTIEHPDDGETWLALGGALCEAGLCREAEEALVRAARFDVEDPGLLYWYLAESRYQQWRFEEARRDIESWLSESPEDAWAWHLLGRVREASEDEEGAEAAYVRASGLEPEQLFYPHRFTEAELEEALAEARAELPPEFQAALDELPVQVRSMPSREMALDDPDDLLSPDLLGLFTGTSRRDSSVFNPLEQPGVVFLFQKNLERVCPDRESLVEEIRITLWHELAHYLGFEEEDMPGLGLE